MQQRRDDGGGVHPQLRQQLGHTYGVDDVWLTRAAALAIVRGVGQLIGPQDGLDVDLG